MELDYSTLKEMKLDLEQPEYDMFEDVFVPLASRGAKDAGANELHIDI